MGLFQNFICRLVGMLIALSSCTYWATGFINTTSKNGTPAAFHHVTHSVGTYNLVIYLKV